MKRFIWYYLIIYLVLPYQKLRKAIYYSSILLMIRAGLPATIVSAGTFLVTTEPAPIMALSPILIPGRMVELAPIQTLLPIWIGEGTSD